MAELPVQHIHQGQTNGCGTAALAMALNTLCVLKNQPAGCTQQLLDREIRRRDLFTAPGPMLQTARRRGYSASFRRATDFAEILAHLERQHPVLALISVNGKPDGLHYVCIQAAWRDEKGVEMIRMVDPAPTLTRQPAAMTFEGFSARYWQPLRPMGLPLGLGRPVLLFSTENDLPLSDPMPWPLTLANLIANVINALPA